MNILKPLLLLMTLVSLWQMMIAIDLEDVQKLADQISSISSSTWDIVSKLRHVSKSAITFVRIASPVGALIAAGADVAFQPESEEYKAIKKLHDFVESKFAALSRHIEHQTNELKFFLADMDYHASITRPLNVIERFYYAITDPLLNRTEYKSEFVALCTDRSSPHNVLLEFKARLYTNCPFPSYDDTSNYAEAVYLFQQIETRHNKNFTFSSTEYDTIKRSILSKASWYYVAEKLEKILLSNDTTSKIEKELDTLHQNIYNSQNLCWPKTVMEGNHWKRHQLFLFAETVRLDLIKTPSNMHLFIFLLLATIASQCANISYSGNPQRVQKELQEIGMLFQEIPQHLALWIEKKLEITWPDVMTSYAKEATGTSPIEESVENYSAAAINIKKVLDKMGPEKYFHNVLLFPDWKDNRQIASICPQFYCLQLGGINGVNAFVVRYEDGQYERSLRAFAWFDEALQLKMENIIESWQFYNSSQTLASLIERMQDGLKGFGDTDLYPNVVSLHNWMFFKADAKITYGSTLTYVRAVPTQQGLNSLVSPPFTDAESFHTHLFL